MRAWMLRLRVVLFSAVLCLERLIFGSARKRWERCPARTRTSVPSQSVIPRVRFHPAALQSPTAQA